MYSARYIIASNGLVFLASLLLMKYSTFVDFYDFFFFFWGGGGGPGGERAGRDLPPKPLLLRINPPPGSILEKTIASISLFTYRSMDTQ